MIEYLPPLDPAILPGPELSRVMDALTTQTALAANRSKPAATRATAARKVKQLRGTIDAHNAARRREIQNAPALVRRLATHQTPERQEYMPLPGHGVTPVSAPSAPPSPVLLVHCRGGYTLNK